MTDDLAAIEQRAAERDEQRRTNVAALGLAGLDRLAAEDRADLDLAIAGWKEAEQDAESDRRVLRTAIKELRAERNKLVGAVLALREQVDETNQVHAETAWVQEKYGDTS